MHALNTLLAGATLLLASSAALAQATPAGLWKTIDDDGKTEKSLVRITDTGGVLTGKVEKIADPAKQGAKCDDCSDARKGQPVLGMTIISGVKAAAGDAGLWEGGEILDPNNGKTYKVRLKPIDGGKALEVRGYIGMPMLGRTQTWQRVE
ncbi:MAG: hypothetical protein RIQ60_1237 [Pseudomonadota bacterium]|jgi:uncharacterized protein (DUF2147 family)